MTALQCTCPYVPFEKMGCFTVAGICAVCRAYQILSEGPRILNMSIRSAEIRAAKERREVKKKGKRS